MDDELRVACIKKLARWISPLRIQRPDCIIFIQVECYSDHRGLNVDLRLSGLFDRNLSPLASPTFRDIRSGAPQKNCKYLAELNHRLAEQNVAARTEILKITANHLEAEALDSIITAAMLEAGKTCAHQARHPVSLAFHTAQT
jgi:hypothetical protein